MLSFSGIGFERFRSKNIEIGQRYDRPPARLPSVSRTAQHFRRFSSRRSWAKKLDETSAFKAFFILVVAVSRVIVKEGRGTDERRRDLLLPNVC